MNLYQLTTCLSTVTLGVGMTAASARSLPNILVICAEDMNADINAYWDVPFETPGLDRLAAMGAVFDNAYAPSPTCSASRAAMLTGLMPHANGQIGLVGRGSRMFPGLPTYVDHLRSQGYYLGVTYKVHVDPEPQFDVGPRDTAWGDPAELVAVARSVMETASREGRPWFMQVNTFDTHSIRKDEAHRTGLIWRHQFAGLPENPLGPEEVKLPPYLAADPNVTAHPNLMDNVAAYYNAVRRVDDTVGRLLDILEERGELADARIMFTSDHGQVWPRGKKFLNEVGVHVPLILVTPEAEPGTRHSALVNLTDMKPTITEWAGVNPPKNIEGRSWPALLRGEVEPRTHVGTQYFQHWGPGGFAPAYSFRDERYKLIYHPFPAMPSRRWQEFPRIPFIQALPNITDQAFARAYLRSIAPPRFELYDLVADRWEFHNLADDPAYAVKRDALKAALDAWRRETGDPFLDPARMTALRELHERAQAQIDANEEGETIIMERMVDALHQLMRPN